MIYLKKVVNQDLIRTPTFNIEAVTEFFKIELDNGDQIYKNIILLPQGENFNVKFQKRETRNEYRVFLNELFRSINPSEGDILMFKNTTNNTLTCEHISNLNIIYEHLNYLFVERENHQIIVSDISELEDKIENEDNYVDEFITWFTKYDGDKHNYFSFAFLGNKEKLKSELLKYEKIYESEFNSKIFTVKINQIQDLINTIKINLEKPSGLFFEFSAKKMNHMPRAIIGKNNYLKFLNEKLNNSISVVDVFNIQFFVDSITKSGLIFSTQLTRRFVSSLCTKPFIICSGLSGSGKTKLAQAFVQWISFDESQYLIVPVGADWTNREPLLGYPNAITNNTYVKPENGVLDLILQAKENFERSDQPTKPYFLILDEMNLSHVERYFADFLSAMESGEEIPLHKIHDENCKIPRSFSLPKNLFIIGTVNIDETTYMFSPKVLDRANTIEFRLTNQNLVDYINSEIPLNLNLLKGEGASMSESFMKAALMKSDKNLSDVEGDLKSFFSELKKSGAEFGYRTASEMGRLMFMLKQFDENGDNLLDIAIMQKLLPKLHGSRNKLTKVLPVLGSFCLKDVTNSKIKEDYLDKYVANLISEEDIFNDNKVKYRISLEKICRMYKNAIENGFASYAEA